MAWILLGVLYCFKFWVSPSQTAVTSSPMISPPSSSDLNPLDYQVWGQCWSLITNCNQSKEQFLSLKRLFSWLGLHYCRKPLTTLWKTTTSDCRHVCQPAADILNIMYVCMYVCPKIYIRRALSENVSRAAVSNNQKHNSYNTYTNCYI